MGYPPVSAIQTGIPRPFVARPPADRSARAVRLFTHPAVAILFVLGLAGSSPASAADVSQAAAASAPLPPAGQRLDERQLSAAIDQYFERYWEAQRIEPAERADDAEFLRRAHLDLVGKIPSVSQVRAFLDASHPDKRTQLVDSLLEEGASATHLANVWRGAMLGGTADDPQIRQLIPQLETWLALRFAANMPYDQLVRELLLAPLSARNQPLRQPVDGVADPTAFYQAVERKPAPLASVTSRVFLGLQVQCAECHDHPHRHWKRNEFWSFASLFSNLRPRPMAANADDDGSDEIAIDDEDETATDANAAAQLVGLKIPDTETIAQPAFLDGSAPAAAGLRRPRLALVHWLTSRENRWFAQAAANRVWEQLLGRGLVDPADDLENAGPNDHAELLEFVARQFEAHDYDLRYLIRAIAGSRLYQFSSRSGPSSSHQRHQFARMPLRRMTGEQLVDSLIQATGLREPPVQRNNPLQNPDSLRAELRKNSPRRASREPKAKRPSCRPSR